MKQKDIYTFAILACFAVIIIAVFMKIYNKPGSDYALAAGLIIEALLIVRRMRLLFKQT